MLVQSGASSLSDTIASHREKKVHSAHGTQTSGPTSSVQPWLCITWKAVHPFCSHSSAHREIWDSGGAVTSSWRWPSSMVSPSISDSQASPDIGADRRALEAAPTRHRKTSRTAVAGDILPIIKPLGQARPHPATRGRCKLANLSGFWQTCAADDSLALRLDFVDLLRGRRAGTRRAGLGGQVGL